MSWKIITLIIGVVTSIITIVTFTGDVADSVSRYIVTDGELAETEQRIIAKVEKEAVLTRTIYIQELIERKTKLSNQLDKAVDPGNVARLIEDIREVNY